MPGTEGLLQLGSQQIGSLSIYSYNRFYESLTPLANTSRTDYFFKQSTIVLKIIQRIIQQHND